jgi:uncharacterized protein (DUF2267 family)
MNGATITSFDRTIEKTRHWLRDLQQELEWDDRDRVYHALRAVLHALRDRLPVQEVADLGAQLPMLVRGFYYEGWSPSRKLLTERKKEQFLDHVAHEFRSDPQVDPEEITRAVLRVLERHVSSGEIQDVKGNLPAAIRDLWN